MVRATEVGTAADDGGSPASAFPLGRRARLAVFASGRGSNLGSLLAAFPPGGKDPLAEVVAVVGNRADAMALDTGRRAGVAVLHHPFGRDGTAFEATVQAFLEAQRVDVIALAGFMRILSAGFVQRWSGRILNIHPSLLPDFPGLHPVRQALDAGVPETGCTVHLVDAGVDSGPVVLQRRLRVLPGEEEPALQARIQQEEHRAYPDALRLLLSGAWRPA